MKRSGRKAPEAGMMWMWRRVLGLATVALVLPLAAAAGPSVTARSAIVVDARSGEVLWEREADVPLPPASTTKVLTAILGLESGRLGTALPVSRYASATAPSKLGLRPGQRMQLEDLLYAVLLNSANDAATVVAEGLGGSEERFAARMTARARQLGGTGSRFHNAHGLTAPGHVSTARDLARFFRYGLGVRGFRDILETRTIQVPVAGPGARRVSLRSHNRLLSGYAYPVIGKTGYTRAARRCFVGAGTKDGREVIIAFLGASDLWGDARAMFAWAFGDPPPAPVVQAKAPRSRAAKPQSRTASSARAAARRVGARSAQSKRSTPAVVAKKRSSPSRAVASRSRNARQAEGDADEERSGSASRKTTKSARKPTPARRAAPARSGTRSTARKASATAARTTKTTKPPVATVAKRSTRKTQSARKTTAR